MRGGGGHDKTLLGAQDRKISGKSRARRDGTAPFGHLVVDVSPTHRPILPSPARRCGLLLARSSSTHGSPSWRLGAPSSTQPRHWMRTVRISRCQHPCVWLRACNDLWRRCARAAVLIAEVTHTHDDKVGALAYSPDGSKVASGGYDSAVILMSSTRAVSPGCCVLCWCRRI